MYNQIERCRLDLQKDPSNPNLHIRLGDLYMKWHLDIYNACQYIDEAITEYQLAMEYVEGRGIPRAGYLRHTEIEVRGFSARRMCR